jgi:hypothetical protein
MLFLHRPISLLLFCFLLAGCCTTRTRIARADNAPWLAGYRYRVPVTLENKSKTEMPAMPVCLRFDALAQMTFNKVRRDGNDLRVADENGQELPRVIEGLYDDSDPARIWVRSTPLPAGAKRTLYIYYGSANAQKPEDAQAKVFSDAAPHVEGTKANLTFDDLLPGISPLETAPLIEPRAVPGYHGPGAWFNGQNTAMTGTIEQAEDLNKGFTISMWYKPIPHQYVSWQYLIAIDNRIIIGENAVRLQTPDGLVDLNYTPRYLEWNHLAATYDGANLIAFLDGEEVARAPVKAAPVFANGAVSLGFDPTGTRFFSNEVLDDVVITSTPRTSFPEAHAPPVLTLGAEETNEAVAAPPDPHAPDVIVPMEAEAMEGVVGRYPFVKMHETLQAQGKAQWFDSHYRTYLSRNYGAFTLTKGATATQTINVPKDGSYQLWARYVPIGEHEYEQHPTTGSGFQVRAEQDGKVVASHEYGKTLDYDPRVARWESATLSLKKGKATFTLFKDDDEYAAAEKVDLLVLTNDKDWLPDYRSLGSLYLRIKILEVAGQGPYRAHIDVLRHDGNPWYQRYFIENSALTMANGHVTPWIDAKPFSGGTYIATATLSLVDSNGVYAPTSKVQLQYARLPFDSAIYKTVESESTRSHGFLLPGSTGDASTFESDSISVVEASRRDLERAKAANWPKDNQPRNITVSINTSIGDFPDEAIRNELTVLKMMGANHTTASHSGWGSASATEIATKELGFDKTTLVQFLDFGAEHKINTSPYDPKFWDVVQKQIDLLAATIRARSGEEEIKRFTWLQLNDEMEEWLAPVGLMKQPVSIEAFKQWLVDKKITPAFLGLNNWDELKTVPDRDATTTPEQKKLWMLEMDFASDTCVMIYTRARQMWEKTLGHSVYTTMLPSPHQFFFRGLATPGGSGLNYPAFWQKGGTTMPWCEDWSYDNGLLFATSEMMSYVAEITNMGGDHSRPTGMYVTSGGADARRQKVMVALARGAKHVNHYTYGPSYANTEGSWSPYDDIFNSIGFMDYEIAKADDLLGPAKAKKAPVAILYPWSSDVWQKNQSSFAEKFHVFLSLVHEQVPVQLVSEEQVENGDLEGRKVLYVLDSHVRRDAVVQIARWVNRGGTLVTTMDGGTKDEYDADSSSFDTLLGLNKRTLAVDADSLKTDFLRGGIGSKKAMGTITFSSPFPNQNVTAYAMKSVADVKSARVLGTWEDGSPAATINASGQGRAIWIGALPGLSYVRGSNMSAEGLTTEYPQNVRSVINAPVEIAKVQKDVELSTPVVEATLQESEKGAIVTLVNYTMKPLDSITMTARPSKPVKRAVLVSTNKEIPFTKTADGISMKLPLGLTEFVKLYY